jgi:hypothetical protein
VVHDVLVPAVAFGGRDAALHAAVPAPVPRPARIEGILRTRYNQYDSIVAPILAWL